MQSFKSRKKILFLLLLLFNTLGLFPQDKMAADSLKNLYTESHSLSEASRLKLLDQIIMSLSSPEEILQYADTMLTFASESEFKLYLASANHHKGVAYRLQGKLKKSLENLFKSIQIAIDIDNHEKQIIGYQELAMTYTAKNELRKAINYEKKAIGLIRKNAGAPYELAIALLNSGYSYYTLGELDSAMLLYNEAYPLFEEVDFTIGKAYCIGNSGLIYWKKGNSDFAISKLEEAINMLLPLGDEYGMADYHNQLANIYFEQNKIEQTIEHAEIALSMAQDLGLKEQIRDAVLLLSKMYARKKDYTKAHQFQTLYIAYKDSIADNDQANKMADMRTDFEVNLRETEIDLLEKKQILNRTYIAIVLIFLILSIMVLLYFRQRFKTTKLISVTQKKQHEKEINDMLNREQTKALQSMVQGRDNERKRLAKDLHNHFGSLLATVKVNLNGIENQNSPKFKTINTLVDQACTDIRNLSHSLNMGISENFGLVPSLKELIAHIQQSGKLNVEFTAAMGETNIESDQEIVIYRIVQELISNALKHAEASKLSVALTCFEDEKLINILVHDNGKGFSPNAKQKDDGGMGLNALDEMVDSLNGNLEIDSNPSSGTTIIIDLPINNEIQ